MSEYDNRASSKMAPNRNQLPNVRSMKHIISSRQRNGKPAQSSLPNDRLDSRQIESKEIRIREQKRNPVSRSGEVTDGEVVHNLPSPTLKQLNVKDFSNKRQKSGNLEDII